MASTRLLRLCLIHPAQACPIKTLQRSCIHISLRPIPCGRCNHPVSTFHKCGRHYCGPPASDSPADNTFATEHRLRPQSDPHRLYSPAVHGRCYSPNPRTSRAHARYDQFRLAHTPCRHTKVRPRSPSSALMFIHTRSSDIFRRHKYPHVRTGRRFLLSQDPQN